MNRPTVRPKVRSDVALIPGYHSPQLDVAVRLNTNEAPEPPPVDFGRRLGELLANADWNRYPDREATRLRTRIAEVEGTTADRVFAANGSNEVLQCLAGAHQPVASGVFGADMQVSLVNDGPVTISIDSRQPE